MNPRKLSDFTKNNLLPAEADKYLKHLVDDEIPKALKKYLEVNIFPHIQMKVSKGISLTTARQWLYTKGFRYTKHQKALYYDGHEWPDVVEYQQETFLPTMKEYCC